MVVTRFFHGPNATGGGKCVCGGVGLTVRRSCRGVCVHLLGRHVKFSRVGNESVGVCRGVCGCTAEECTHGRLDVSVCKCRPAFPRVQSLLMEAIPSRWTFAGIEPELGIGLIYALGSAAIVVQHRVTDMLYFALVAGVLCLPFCLVESAVAGRALATLLSLYYTVRLVQLHGSWSYFCQQSIMVRYAHVFCTFHDIRVRKVLPRAYFDMTSFVDLVRNSLFTVVAVHLLRRYGNASQSLEGAAISCCFGGCVGLLSLNIMCALLRFLALLTGPFELPRLMDGPAESTSLAEFWGQRWNTVVQALLKKYIYTPLRARGIGRSTASALTFFASGIGHTMPIFCGLKDLTLMGAMLAYFVVQFSLLVLQKNMCRHAGLSASFFGWASTMLSVLLPAPLFVLPAQCLMDRVGSSEVAMAMLLNPTFWRYYATRVVVLLTVIKIGQRHSVW